MNWITFIIALSALTLAVGAVMIIRMWKVFVEDLHRRVEEIERRMGVKKD